MTVERPPQRDVAVAYASHLEMKGGLWVPDRETDWPCINAEIVSRYGARGFKHIKRLAWQIAEQGKR